MDDSPYSQLVSDTWAEQIAEVLQAQRRRVHEFLAAQRARFEQIEKSLVRALDVRESSLQLDQDARSLEDGKSHQLNPVSGESGESGSGDHVRHQQGEVSQSPAVARSAENAAAVDADAVVQQEREHLARLKAQWQETLRLAEVEVSVERAKIARQQAEIAEKLRALAGAGKQDSEATPAGKPPRGRWLARLGLKDFGEK